jgi:hypothetical protein
VCGQTLAKTGWQLRVQVYAACLVVRVSCYAGKGDEHQRLMYILVSIYCYTVHTESMIDLAARHVHEKRACERLILSISV